MVKAALFKQMRFEHRHECVYESLSHVLLFCNSMDYSPPGCSVPEISQASLLEWVPFSRGSSRPRDQAHVSCIAGRFFTTEPPGKPQIRRHWTVTETFPVDIQPVGCLEQGGAPGVRVDNLQTPSNCDVLKKMSYVNHEVLRNLELCCSIYKNGEWGISLTVQW